MTRVNVVNSVNAVNTMLRLSMLRGQFGALIVNVALERTLASGDLVLEKIDGQDLVFLPHLKRAEEGIAARIKTLAAAPPNYPPIDLEKAPVWCQQKTGKDLAPSQQAALKQAN